MPRANVAKSAAGVNGLQLVQIKGIQYCLATYQGQTKSLSDWAAFWQVPRQLLYRRIVCDGWSIEDAFEKASVAGEQHGRTSLPEYSVWNGMWKRCTGKNEPSYANYGGRGITVCERWKSFSTFLSDMGSRPSPQHTLDRTDNDKGYCPENCKWATRAEQNRNKRNTVLIAFRGKEMILTDWAKELGISFQRLWGRLKLKWTVERAFTTPIRKVGRKLKE